MNLELINSRIASAGFPFVLTDSDFDDDFHRTRDKLWYRANKVYLKDNHIYISVYGGDYRDQSRRLSVTITFNDLGLEVNEANHKSKREIAKLRKKAEKELSATNIATMIQAQDRWTEWCKVQVQELSSYEKKKGIPHSPTAIVIKNFDDNQRLLAIPMFDDSGSIWNIQTIYATGKKLLMGGGKKLGLHHTIHGLQDKTFICEGFATGVAINAATGSNVVVSFDAGNLESAYLYAKKNFHESLIIIAADWDGETMKKIGKNPGAFAAREVARIYGALVAFPIPKQDQGLQVNLDFADLWPDVAKLRSDLDMTVSYDALKDGVYDTPKPKVGSKLKEQIDKALENMNNDSGPNHILGPPPTPTTFQPENNHESATFPPPETPIQIDPEDFPTLDDGFFTAVIAQNGSVRWVPDYDGFAHYMGERHRLVASDGFTYIYRDGYFHSLSRLGFMQLVQKTVRTNTKPSDLKAFMEAAQAQNFVRPEDFKPREGFINLANGVLDVKDKILHPHSPTFYFTYKLAHNYMPGAECPNWQGFLMNVFENNVELANVFAEMFGYVLIGGNPFLHKTFVLEGTGRNGKSTALDILEEMVGRENVSSVRLEDLGNPFATVRAQGKLVNLVGEASKGEINSDLFKGTTAGETVMAGEKHQPNFPMRWTARHIIACNKLPFFGDTTTGGQERLFILPFNRYFKDEERIVNFGQKYLSPEMPGILMWALAGLDRLMARGRLPIISAVEAAHHDMRLESDPFFVWWTESFEHTSGPSPRFWVSDLYRQYAAWAESLNKRPMSNVTFGKKMKGEVEKGVGLKYGRLDNRPYVEGLLMVNKKLNKSGWMPSSETEIEM